MIHRGEQRETIAFLSRPETYDCAGPVDRVETHGAIVFLAGDFAYKLKRAVRLPYLDFSSVEKRHRACLAELELNRRTAPDLYREVLPIRGAAGGHLSFKAGDPVDWLVVMRRFPDDALLEKVAERGELDRPMTRDLADRIAAFHDQAAIIRSGSGAARARNVIEGNRASMAALDTGLLPPDLCEDLHRHSVRALGQVSQLLDQRLQAGRVRHCHGDLHLANICLWNGRPTLFDCLEFDAELATCDVLYDLAFLLMDLWERGYCSQACQLFNRYCDIAQENAGLASLPLFLSMRAAVRCHVSASAASTQETERARNRKLAEARAYGSASLAFLEAERPQLVAIGGLSGTGKSTVAGALAHRMARAPGARWLRSDVIRKRAAGVLPEERLPAGAYSTSASSAVYAKMEADALAILEAGHSVILDAVFARPSEREAVGRLARRTRVKFSGFWLSAPPDILALRLAGRRGDASDADRSVLMRQLSYQIGDVSAWTRVDAGQAPEEVASRIASALNCGVAPQSPGSSPQI